LTSVISWELKRRTTCSSKDESMQKITILCLSLAAVLFLGPAAKADTYSYTISSATLNGWIDFAVTPLVGGNYGIDNVWGDLNSADFHGSFTSTTIGGYPSESNHLYGGGCCQFEVDNVLYPGSNPVLDWYGVFFADGGHLVNLWGTGSGTYAWGDDGSFGNPNQINPITMTPTPEPGSLLLLGTGLLGLATLAFRKSKVSLPTLSW
jgi:hypothetical protein